MAPLTYQNAVARVTDTLLLTNLDQRVDAELLFELCSQVRTSRTTPCSVCVPLSLKKLFFGT